MKLISDLQIRQACDALKISNLADATIGEIVLLSNYLHEHTGIPFIRMDQGSPGLPPNKYGIAAEKRALDSGIGAKYPPAGGVPELKDAASRFIKAFLDVDITPRSCVPTTGSVAASFGSFAAVCGRIPGKDKVLFVDPGFSVQKDQLRILGLGWRSFDIYNYRGAAKMRAKLRSILEEGDVAAMIYSNPDNPAWTCLEEEELRVIGELATEFDVVVIEDLAYFGMDYRKDLGHPFVPPYVPTVARYTDNYILMLSSSKIFSYAGQRMALACISDSLFERQYPALAARYADSGVFGLTMIASILYLITSGCTTSTQYAYAEMLNLACDGTIDFISDTREYEMRAARMKDIFCRHGFYVVYSHDVTLPVGDGFFFSLGYPGLNSGELVHELLAYGVSSISLSTTGSGQEGVRVCVSPVTEDLYPFLDERMAEFREDHPF